MKHRTDKDFAIEFGEYLAQSAEIFQRVMNETLQAAIEHQELDHDAINDHWVGLSSAIYEFRKRACRATIQPQAGLDYFKITREILGR